jgi:ubiquitin C-terminal hydrolase
MENLSFLNSGNTCYFNSALQLKYLVDYYSNSELKMESGPIDVSDKLEQIREKTKKFTQNKEHDSHEVFIELIDEDPRFSGKLRQKTQCSLCKTITPQDIDFNTLYFDSFGTFREQFIRYFSKSQISFYQCEKCQCSCDAVHYFNVVNLPEFLCIKLHTKVLPMKFNINSNEFKLIGICCYFGNSNSGHYVAYILIQNQWYLKDDDAIKMVEAPDIKTVCYCIYLKN